MQAERKQTIWNSVLTVVSGIIIYGLTLLISFPLFSWLLQKIQTRGVFNEKGEITSPGVIALSISISWTAIASLVSGLSIVQICRKKEYRHVAIVYSLLLVYILIIYFQNTDYEIPEMAAMLCLILCDLLCFLWGAREGLRIKNRRNRRKEEMQLELSTQPDESVNTAST